MTGRPWSQQIVYRSAQNLDSLELGIHPVQMGSLESKGCSGGGEKKIREWQP